MSRTIPTTSTSYDYVFNFGLCVMVGNNPGDGEIRVSLAICLLTTNKTLRDDLGLSLTDLCILCAVGMCCQQGRLANISKVADMTRLPHTTATRMMEKLTEDGWLTEVRHNGKRLFDRGNENMQNRLSKFRKIFEASAVKAVEQITAIRSK